MHLPPLIIRNGWLGFKNSGWICQAKCWISTIVSRESSPDGFTTAGSPSHPLPHKDHGSMRFCKACHQFLISDDSGMDGGQPWICAWLGAVIDLLAATTSKASINGIQTIVHSQVDDKMWPTQMKMGKSCFLFINWAGAFSASSQRSTLTLKNRWGSTGKMFAQKW